MTRFTGYNPNNDTARSITAGVRNQRRKGPSVVLRYRWYQEYLEKGLDKKMKFFQYLRSKTATWHKNKRKKFKP